MIPVVTAAQMKAVDASFPGDQQQLIRRAGWAVAVAARRMLSGTYGRRVTVVAGRGNNGNDGHVAAELLRQWGARVAIVEPGVSIVGNSDLVIDAAFGTGFRGALPETSVVEGVPVLAVDIPSGVCADTGEAVTGTLRADRTVTFAALKPGLVFGAGRELSGSVDVVDIGLGPIESSAHVVECSDVQRWVPQPKADSHKWASAVGVVAGSPGMRGAATFCAVAAGRAGSGMVRAFSPGVTPEDLSISEAVAIPTPAEDWSQTVLDESVRLKAIAVGPGLGRADRTRAEVLRLVGEYAGPLVLDADALSLIAGDLDSVAGRPGETVLTPHDGEFRTLDGSPPGSDRIEACRRLAKRSNCCVLLKGPTTVVADPQGEVLISTEGGHQLATAGTGDVLTGIIAALLAHNVPAARAACTAAFVHGRAAKRAPEIGMLAGDLPHLVSHVFSEMSGITTTSAENGRSRR